MQPQVGTRAFVGVMFDSADGTHYGWVDVETYGTGFRGTVWRYAYESDPGVGIRAGAVPEVGVVWLVVLGGAVVVFGRQRGGQF